MANQASNPTTVTLEQLIALNDEMAALIRAGIPLESGLAALGGTLPRQPAELVQRLASRLASGENLSQILADGSQFPPVWRAVVQAGLRSGRLAQALESLSTTARRLAESRRLIGAGLIYPLIVICLAYGLFVFLTVWYGPVVFQAGVDLTGHAPWSATLLNGLGQHVWWWAIPVPMVVGLGLVGWWRRQGQALWSKSGRPRTRRWGRGNWRLLSLRQTLGEGRRATFAEVLALLVEQQVPLHESLVLAAEASGDRSLSEGAREVASRLERGEGFTRRETLPAEFPPLLGWLLMGGMLQHSLAETLRRSARVYRERSARAATGAALYGPILVTVLVGGTFTVLCALMAFLPLAQMLYQLTQPLF